MDSASATGGLHRGSKETHMENVGHAAAQENSRHSEHTADENVAAERMAKRAKRDQPDHGAIENESNHGSAGDAGMDVDAGSVPHADELYAPYTWLWPQDIDAVGDGAGCARDSSVVRRREVAVGALLCRPRDVQRVLELLAQLQAALGRNDAMELGPIARGKVLRYTPPADDPAATAGLTMSIHVSPTAAIEIANHASLVVPTALRELITAGNVMWRPGLRVGSPGCVSKSRPKEEQYRESLAEQCHHRRREKDTTTTTTTDTDTTDSSEVASPASPPLFRFAELFAGIGGFRVALDALGGECVFASEIDHEARCTYAANFGDLTSGDITEVEAASVPSFDVLTAGFPCQSHSVAGFQRGFDDFRGCLFFEVTRMLNAHSPKAFVLENVPNLAETNGGKALLTVLAELARAGRGYTVLHRVVNATAWVPQQRERLYFVGFLTETGCAEKFIWPDDATPCPVTVRDVLERDDDVSSEHTLSDHKWRKVQRSKKTRGVLKRRLAKLDGHARTLCSNYRRGYSHMSEFVPHGAGDDGTPTDHQALYNAALSKSVGGGTAGSTGEAGPAVSLRAPVTSTGVATDDVDGGGNPGEVGNGHDNDNGNDVDDDDDNDDDDDDDDDGDARADGDAVFEPPAGANPRFYTPRECARLMGFPEWFVIDDTCKSKHRMYHQLGNAVVPPVVGAITRQVIATGVFTR